MTLELDFGLAHLADRAVRDTTRAVSDAVDRLSIGVAAGATNVDASDLRKQLDMVNSRYLSLGSTIRIGARATLDDRLAIATPFNRALGFGRPIPEREMTDAEARHRLEGALRALGDVGHQILRTAYGGQSR